MHRDEDTVQCSTAGSSIEPAICSLDSKQNLLTFLQCKLCVTYGFLAARWPDLNPLEGNFFLRLLGVAVVLGYFYFSFLASLYVAASATPDPDRGPSLIRWIRSLSRPAWWSFFGSLAAFPALSTGLCMGGSFRSSSFISSTLQILVVWGVTGVPAYLVFFLCRETEEAYFRRKGIPRVPKKDREKRRDRTPAWARTSPQAMEIAQQLVKAGVPTSVLEKELAALLNRASEKPAGVSVQALREEIEEQITAVLKSGKERHLVEAEIEFIRAEYARMYPEIDFSAQ